MYHILTDFPINFLSYSLVSLVLYCINKYSILYHLITFIGSCYVINSLLWLDIEIKNHFDCWVVFVVCHREKEGNNDSSTIILRDWYNFACLF